MRVPFPAARTDRAVVDAVVAPLAIHVATGGHRILHRSHSQGELCFGNTSLLELIRLDHAHIHAFLSFGVCGLGPS